MRHAQPLLECVPNFSEGRDQAVIDAIAEAIRSVPAVHLLDVDPGASAHRTVMTLAGPPEAVVEAAFRAIARAAERIDMRQHRGTHPRMGATDVCPLVPVQDITLAETVAYAEQLAERVGRELGIPVYLYEAAARRPERRNLATIRAGEYEGFAQKILDPAWVPDYGPARFHPQAGQTVIGARPFLVAYNINLDTGSVPLAHAIACDVRERGRIKTIDGQPEGEKVRDAQGKLVWEPGQCRAVKAIGWYIPEYGRAQVSTNLTDLSVTPLHVAFEAVRAAATRRGVGVTGSELIGLVPRQCLLEAGHFYREREGLPPRDDEADLVARAVQALGLDDLRPFDPQQKVLEYRLAADGLDVK